MLERPRSTILSPQEGAVYRVPSGVERRYATVALQPGPHRIRAVDGAGESVEVKVAVE